MVSGGEWKREKRGGKGLVAEKDDEAVFGNSSKRAAKSDLPGGSEKVDGERSQPCTIKGGPVEGEGGEGICLSSRRPTKRGTTKVKGELAVVAFKKKRRSMRWAKDRKRGKRCQEVWGKVWGQRRAILGQGEVGRGWERRCAPRPKNKEVKE